MAELKQSRWVKIHEPGNANFDEKDNIMDIVVGGNRAKPRRPSPCGASARRRIGC